MFTAHLGFMVQGQNTVRTTPSGGNSSWTETTHLVAGEDAERLHDLVRGVGVGRLPSHEVQERVERDVAHVIGVDVRHDALEISITLTHTDNNTDLTAFFQDSLGRPIPEG